MSENDRSRWSGANSRVVVLRDSHPQPTDEFFANHTLNTIIALYKSMPPQCQRVFWTLKRRNEKLDFLLTYGTLVQ